MQKVNLNIYEGDDNIIGYNEYNLNRVLSTGQIDLQKRDQYGILKSVVVNTSIIANKNLGLTSILDNTSFNESYRFILDLEQDTEITITKEILQHLNNIKQYLPEENEIWTKESNIINISGYKTDNLIIICSPEGILKCNINTSTNKLIISVFSLLTQENYLRIKPSYIFLNEQNNNTENVEVLSNTDWNLIT